MIMSNLPYPLKYKLPLQYLSVEDWNNFVNDLLLVYNSPTGILAQYYNNGNLQNLNEVFAKTLNVLQLYINGYQALYNLKKVLAYTFGNVFSYYTTYPPINFSNVEQLTKLPSFYVQKYNIPVAKVQQIFQIYNFIFEKHLPQITKTMQVLIPKLSYRYLPSIISGGMATISGSQTLSQILQNEFGISNFSTWKGVTIENLSSNNLFINNAIVLMPKQCLKISASSPSEVTITAQQPSLISTLLEFGAIPVTAYAITVTNSQSDPTSSNFQQLLTLNLSGIISSPSQLLNLKFCQDVNCNTQLYAWIEYYTSDLSTVYIWVLLPGGIPANSSITIYMFVTNTNQYPYTGVNSYYNTQYDNGMYVFDAYMNFMGTSPIPSNYNAYTNISGFPQFVAESGTTPGYLYTFNNASGSYDTVYISAPNSARTPEIFEGMAYYNGSADQQGIMFFGELSSGWCGVSNPGNAYYLCDSWTTDWDPYDGAAYIWQGSTQENSYGESLFTSDGYNFYQVIATSSEIIFNGATTNNPTTPYAQLNIQNVFTYSGSITVYGDVVGTIDGSGGATHYGYWYYVRARAYPPNGVMPTNSQPQKIIAYIT
ncbi:putative viral structural protein [Saccharolobus solfataricus rod-shaped virus 1]|uniref:Putative viral structural protein n=1 Tax=Saccharolobus solfataricus rod-shaped virus 1 TaxID=2730619 RepID=A0A6M3VWI4_SSRV1|nr:putative viral structural protein [Saccharolobus solfataricus rod-shaped virus 1]QJF12298.1 putative viral structural protein [Saccharolobus solfataricus rod-shaped virus 1]